jgi:hypothetical protein
MLKGTTTLYLLASAALVVGAAAPAAAQTPRVEVSALYQALYDSSVRERFPAGWGGDVAVHISDTWSVVAEVGGVYRSDTDLDLDLSLLTWGGGPRWSRWRTSRIVPFAQLLLGLARMGSSANIAGGEIRMSQTRLMLQPAGGVTVGVGRGWGVASQVGYRRILLNAEQDGNTGFNEITVAAGVRVGF